MFLESCGFEVGLAHQPASPVIHTSLSNARGKQMFGGLEASENPESK